ncbi:MAG: serine/threonine protein kinase, partial [Acidobacteriota bacterium]|nr:serine/threonine protein kinase [Acidobacteriota bacterium]
MTLARGTRLGPYEVLMQIGSGGMGEVYRARDTRLDRDVAIKVLPAGMADDRDRLARFEREARVLASLNHPNIATIYGLEELPSGKALVMELVDGNTLKSPLPLPEALRAAIQVALALEAAHQRGITHRDLKPANIMVTRSGVKLLDFGLAKVTGCDEETVTQTQAGTIVGTACYMSPEQARGLPVDSRSDIFSFGAVLYEMLTGRRAFHGDSLGSVLASDL